MQWSKLTGLEISLRQDLEKLGTKSWVSSYLHKIFGGGSFIALVVTGGIVGAERFDVFNPRSVSHLDSELLGGS